MCATTRSRLPPEPWLTSTAAPFFDGTYQADWSSPIRTSSCGMPSEASWISQRGAWVIIRAPVNAITTKAVTIAPPSHASQPRSGRRGRRGAAAALTPEAMSSSPPSAMPTPVRSVQSAPEFTTCRPCETTPKPTASRPMTTPRSRRVGRARRGCSAAQAAGTATIPSKPGIVVSGPETARSSRCRVMSARPANSSGRSRSTFFIYS